MKKLGFNGLFVLLLAMSACSSLAPTSPNKNPAPTATRLVIMPTVEATGSPTLVRPTGETTRAAGNPEDATAAILAALDALDKNGPYRMTITASSDPGAPVTLDVVPPDRSYYRGSVNGKPAEVVNIGSAAYVLNPDGTWQTSTSADSGTTDLVVDPAALNDLTNVEVLAPQILNGTPTTVYSFVDAASPEAKVTLWVSQDKGRPVQMQTTSPDETVLYAIEYDASIKVEAPLK
jgi:hypothetical protein